MILQTDLFLPLLIGFNAICIALVAQVFMFSIIYFPHDVALTFHTCPVHTGNCCTGRADNTQDNTKKEVLLIQEYYERGIQNRSDKKNAVIINRPGVAVDNRPSPC